MNIIIKKVKSDKDFADSMTIRRDVFIVEQSVPVSIERDEFEASCDHFMSPLDGEVVSTGRLRRVDSIIKFERIASLKKVRGKGIGRKLMSFMQEYAQAKYPGYILKMHAQASAISFYTQIGWIAEGEIFEEAGIEHQIMTFS